MTAVEGGCRFWRALNVLVALVILACAAGHVRGARKLQQDALNDEEILQHGDFFNEQTESHIKAIEAAIAALTAEDGDSLHRMLFAGTGTYPSPPSPAPPSPPPSPSPPPPLPPGLAVELQDYHAKFVNASITADLDVTNAASLETFINDFKNITAQFFGVSKDEIIIRGVYKGGQRLTRRMMLARAERTWTHRQLAAALPPGSNMRLLIHVRSYAADYANARALRESEFALVHPSTASSHYTSTERSEATTSVGKGARTLSDLPLPTSRLLQEADAAANVVIVDFTIVRYVEVSLPTSPPPSPPLSPGQVAPPNAPQSPPQRPPRPPPMQPFVLERLAEDLGAERVYITLPPPSPPMPSPLLPPTPPPVPVVYINVTDISAQGSLVSISNRVNQAPAGTVVWYDDPDFRSFRKPHSALNLVFIEKRLPCSAQRGVCEACPRAWRASQTELTVPLYFREPVQVDTIKILQLQSPGVLKVELLPWPATVIPELPHLQPRPGTLAAVWDVAQDPSMCGEDLVIRVPLEVSGMNISVPLRATQEDLPRKFRGSAAGGLLITVKAQRRRATATVIEAVRVSGRILYPRNPMQFTGGL